MTATLILVATSTKGFGELIQQTLEDAGRFQVLLVDSVEDAIDCTQRMLFPVCILDSAIKGGTLKELSTILRGLNPDLRLIIIPPNNDLSSPVMEAISPHGYLTKPFYLPDLFDTIEEVLIDHPDFQTEITSSQEGGSVKEKDILSDSTSPASDWMQDINRAAQHLTRLSLESSAQAALIVQNNELWAYAGQLSQQATQELTSIVANYWSQHENNSLENKQTGIGDMVRFVRLETTNSEHMLYATSLGEFKVLAIAFDAETPFSKIRTQAGHLARALSSSSEDSALEIEMEHTITVDSTSKGKPVTTEAESSVEPLLDNVPPPKPQTVKRKRISEQKPTSSPMAEDVRYRKQTDSTRTKPDTHSLERKQGVEQRPSTVESSNLQTSNGLSEMAPSEFPPVDKGPRIDQRGPEIDSFASVGTPTTSFTPMQSINYTCLLIPRFPHHHLKGDIANYLSEWMVGLCIAYGWRLKHLSIQTEFMEWIVNVPPSTSPNDLVSTLREQTSRKIFTAFPLLARENPSGDFWAPGYLITSSAQPLPAIMINEYIQQTRHYQGAPKSRTR
jgi:REP element-mobilizing transposase RayT/DNA-binding response OmpR family regulator